MSAHTDDGIDVRDTDRIKVWAPDGSLVAAVPMALILAAPDLLEALLFIVNDAEPGEDARLTSEGYALACAAIAKTEGRS